MEAGEERREKREMTNKEEQREYEIENVFMYECGCENKERIVKR